MNDKGNWLEDILKKDLPICLGNFFSGCYGQGISNERYKTVVKKITAEFERRIELFIEKTYRNTGLETDRMKSNMKQAILGEEGK